MAGYKKIVASQFGGSEVLQLREFEQLPEPNAGEVRVRVEAAGVGYTDTIVRRGRYHLYTAGLPLTPGYDMVGVVDKLGEGVTGLKIGERVADMPVHGSYSEFIVRPASELIPVPVGAEPVAAADVPLMWMTAWQMLTRSVSLTPGEIILVVGASGAVGRALVILAQHLGATAIDYRRADLLEGVRSLSDGKGVAAAFDAVGGASWETSWAALSKGGKLVGYGMQDFLESGAASSEAGKQLQQFNETWNANGISDGTQRSTTFYDINIRRTSHPDEYRTDAEHLLGQIAEGKLLPPAAEILRLDQAAEAHRRVADGGLRQRLVICP